VVLAGVTLDRHAAAAQSPVPQTDCGLQSGCVFLGTGTATFDDGEIGSPFRSVRYRLDFVLVIAPASANTPGKVTVIGTYIETFQLG
jgi:hypothetical protein